MYQVSYQSFQRFLGRGFSKIDQSEISKSCGGNAFDESVPT